MRNLQTTEKLSISPRAQSRELATLIVAKSNKLEVDPAGNCSISAEHRPSGSSRRALEDRSQEIGLSLAPARTADAGAEITRMFAAFPSFRLEADRVRAVVASYIELIRYCPLWAVEKARYAVAFRGGSFPPSAGDFAVECAKIVEPFLAEKRSIDRVLTATVIDRTDAGRERVQAMTDAFKAGLPPDERKTAGWRPPTKAEAEDWLAAHQGGAGLAPVTKFSDHLVRQLKGELPIGEGRTSHDRLTPEQIDEFAREVL